jgi:hypothetical protein
VARTQSANLHEKLAGDVRYGARLDLAEGLECRSHLLSEEFRLLPGSKVPTPVYLVKVDKVAVGFFYPGPRRVRVLFVSSQLLERPIIRRSEQSKNPRADCGCPRDASGRKQVRIGLGVRLPRQKVIILVLVDSTGAWSFHHDR